MTSSNSANTSDPAAENSAMTRQQKLDIIRNTIRQEQFTPEELAIPPTFNLLAACRALQTFPIKITTNKLIIILALSSLPLTTHQLQLLTGAEQSTLSHIFTDLKDQGFITTQKHPRQHSTHTLTPQGKQLFHIFTQHYFKTIDTLTTLKKNST